MPMEQVDYQSIIVRKVPLWDNAHILGTIDAAESAYGLKEAIVTQAEICTFIVQQMQIGSETHVTELFESLEKPYCFEYFGHEYESQTVALWIYVLAEITAQYARRGKPDISAINAAYAIRLCIDDIASCLLTTEERSLKKSTNLTIDTLTCTKTLLRANTYHSNNILNLGIFTGKIFPRRAEFLKDLFLRYPEEYIRREPIEKITIDSLKSAENDEFYANDGRAE